MKILISDPISQDGLDYLEQQDSIEVVYQPDLSPDDLVSEIGDAAGLIVRSKTQVTAELLTSAHHLRVIGRAGAGVDNIDLDAATRKGVVVMNTPGGNSTSAAEHAFALLMALARKIRLADLSLRAGNWNKKAFIGQELHGKTLGIMGVGKIGSILAHRAQAFHMTVVAYDPFVSEEYANELGIELCPIESVLSRSDFVSLHLPSNEKTRHLMCDKTFKLMKKGAFLINAARGDLVAEEDLADALEEGHLGGAGLDVFENEPDINPRLLASDRSILTPHIAGSTIEAQSKVGSEIAQQVTTYLQQEVILNAVNFPSMSSAELDQIQPYVSLGEKLGSFISQVSGIRLSEVGIRYYGELAQLNYKPIGNYILKAILKPILSEEVNQVNARNYAKERGINVIETVSTRPRSYTNLISIQLRSPEKTEWIEGAILHRGNLRLVSIDGIPVETALGNQILFIRNEDTPGVIGQVGMILGEAKVNIASFVLGREGDQPYAVGVVNTDGDVQKDTLDKIRNIPAVTFAQLIRL
ncbi:MAG: phosphoglycerate dehydrogenase [Acidobacteriota bacterium]